MAAMKLKHVFTQNNAQAGEARELAAFAAEKKLTTQMGVKTSPAHRTVHAPPHKGASLVRSKRSTCGVQELGYDASGGKSYPGLDWNLWLGTAPAAFH